LFGHKRRQTLRFCAEAENLFLHFQIVLFVWAGSRSAVLIHAKGRFQRESIVPFVQKGE